MESNLKEVFIYGDIWGGWSLDSLRWQLQEANGKDVLVKINSFGGDVDEGFMMYNELRRYATENKVTITTFAEGNCASIATVPFLAGDKRIVNEYMQPFIHNAWMYVEGDSKVMKKAYEITENATSQIAKFYSERTSLTYEEARDLMEKESFITAEDCVKYNFAHEIESVQAPINKLVKPINKLKPINMSKPKESLFNRLMTIFKPVNLMIFTADEKTLDFYELNDDEIPEVGNKAKIDGKPVQDVYTDGLVKLPNGEVYKFEGETLVEKIPAGDVEDKLTDEEYEKVIEQAGIANKALRDEVSTLKNKLSKYETVENSFKGNEKNKPENKKETRNSFEEALKKFKK